MITREMIAAADKSLQSNQVWITTHDITDALEAVFASMSPEQLREFASLLITEANERDGYTVD